MPQSPASPRQSRASLLHARSPWNCRPVHHPAPSRHSMPQSRASLRHSPPPPICLLFRRMPASRKPAPRQPVQNRTPPPAARKKFPGRTRPPGPSPAPCYCCEVTKITARGYSCGIAGRCRARQKWFPSQQQASGPRRVRGPLLLPPLGRSTENFVPRVRHPPSPLQPSNSSLRCR